MRKNIVAGNWKMNKTLQEGIALAKELNGQGPDIDDEAVNNLFAKLDKLQDGDTLILAGSIPASLPSDIYEKK